MQYLILKQTNVFIYYLVSLSIQAPNYDTFNSIDRNPILDNEPSKFKSGLIKRGSLASRHLPQQQQSSSSRPNSEDTQNQVGAPYEKSPRKSQIVWRQFFFLLIKNF